MLLRDPVRRRDRDPPANEIAGLRGIPSWFRRHDSEEYAPPFPRCNGRPLALRWGDADHPIVPLVHEIEGRITTGVVAGAAAIGTIAYVANSKSAAAAAAAGATPAKQQSMPVTPGSWYVFDIVSSSKWNVAGWSGAPLLAALEGTGGGTGLMAGSGGFSNVYIEADPSDPTASTYLVLAQWPANATAKVVTDSPPAWSIQPATWQSPANPPMPQSYTIANGDWYTFTIWTALNPSDPNFATYVKEMLTSLGWGTATAAPSGTVYAGILVTQSASNPANAHVAAQWTGQAGGSFSDGVPLWGLLAPPTDTGSTSQPAQPAST